MEKGHSKGTLNLTEIAVPYISSYCAGTGRLFLIQTFCCWFLSFIVKIKYNKEYKISLKTEETLFIKKGITRRTTVIPERNERKKYFFQQ